MKHILFLTLIVFVLNATGQNININSRIDTNQLVKRTKSGLLYKITKGESNSLLKQGQLFKYNLEYSVPNKDTVLLSTFGRIPLYLIVDSSKFDRNNFTSIIPECAPGDEIEFVVSIDTLKNSGMLSDYNDIFKKGETIKGKVEILVVLPDENAANNDYNKEVNFEKQREIADLKKYAKANNIKIEEDSSGVLVSIDNAGDGEKIDSGKVASIFYKGYYTNGKVFDSIINKPENIPFAISIGTRKIIPGLEEGLKHFSKGGKGKLLIPALLAYGVQGAPPIDPYSNLIFDIEVKDVSIH